MKYCYHIAIILFVVFTFNACSNEVDVMSEYEENAAVFALLDPSQPVQYVKINKVFSNRNISASEAAKIGDSLFFDSLVPTITEVETGRIIQLFKTNVLSKDPGYFANSPNYLYATTQKIYAANPVNNYEFYHYRLDLDLPSKKKHIYALTDIPDSIVLLGPATMAQPTNKYMEFSTSIRLAFQAPTNSKIIDSYFFFSYLEVNKKDTNIKTVKTIKWRLINNYRVMDYNAHESVNVVNYFSFYDLLLSRISQDTTVIRRFLPCALELTAGNQEFDNYLQVSIPFIGIVQKQKEYTNVINGVGLFASRRISRYNNIQIGPYTRKSVTTLPEYKYLGFED